jgi:hypothetical protein
MERGGNHFQANFTLWLLLTPACCAGDKGTATATQQFQDVLMLLIQRQATSHWYMPNGQPFHEIAKKDGPGYRPLTVADARRVGALPSVTNVLGVVAKPGLNAWKIEQGIMAALTLPRQLEEPLDVFAHRVVTDMGEQVEKAADFGSAIHAACELYAIERQMPEDPLLREHLTAWVEWFHENVERVASVEQVFVHSQHGYAGRVDMVALLREIGWAVIDFKTQKVRRSLNGQAKPAFYETWPLQLAAYRGAILARGDVKNSLSLVSIIIDSAQPGPVHIKVWDDTDYFSSFLAALELWKYVKGYDPVPGPPTKELKY